MQCPGGNVVHFKEVTLTSLPCPAVVLALDAWGVGRLMLTTAEGSPITRYLRRTPSLHPQACISPSGLRVFQGGIHLLVTMAADGLGSKGI